MLTLTATLLVLNSFGQSEFQKVDREQIKTAIQSKTALTYYPTLLNRFISNDTSLNLTEYRLLYYGFVFQPNYVGYPDFQTRRINDAVEKKDYATVLYISDSILEKIPISMTGNYYKGLGIYLKDKNDTSFIRYRDRYKHILNAIVSSGDGLSCKTAFKTIFVSDEYNVMYEYFEVEKFLGQSLETPCDRMTVSPSKYFQNSSMYFDTSETLLSMEKLLKNK